MKQKPSIVFTLLAFAVLLPVSDAHAQRGRNAPPTVELTDAGKAAEARYSAMQQTLKAEIEAALPKQNDARTAAWLQAIQAQEAAAKEATAKAGEVSKLERDLRSLQQLEESAKLPPKTFADAQEEMREILARGDSNPKLAELLKSEQAFQAHIEKEQNQLNGRIENARKKATQAQAALPAATKAAEDANQASQRATATAWQAMDAMGMDAVLGSSTLDGKLAGYTVITQATPRGLAEFAQQSPEHEKLIEQLLAAEDLIIQMLIADGPNGNQYGETIKIYSDILKASPMAKDGVYQKLALAVSLGHAVPIKKRTPTANTSEEFIDPVQRYLSYEKWYSEGELQPGFKDLCVWNMVMVVDGTDPDEAFEWGREMLRTLRPDCIPRDEDTSVFVDVVDKEIAYTSQNVSRDDPEAHVMQNILWNGGICGRRAFFGRFILRAFGVPATARSQPGHATLAHWHPDGWQTRLGGSWGPGNRGRHARMNRTRSQPYGSDLNFLASSQARADEGAFMRVKRAQWIGALVGEAPKPGFITPAMMNRNNNNSRRNAAEPKPIFWNELALYEQQRIVTKLHAAGKQTVPNVSSSVAMASGATGKVTVDGAGIITIPSAATSSPLQDTFMQMRSGPKETVDFIQDMSGATILHLSRYSRPEDTFEYTFDAPKAGKYQLVAKVATPSPSRSLFVTANQAPAVELELPYTLGLWDSTSPIEIELQAGTNVLKFQGPARVTFDHFTLTPSN
ncbi:MAG: hypothetical protein ACNA8L_08460 [Luteolibacter sp.]